jgi:N-acetylated-alpha-linked acidic dipeptidase
VLALRIANAEILPFDFAFYGDNIRQFVQEIQKGTRTGRDLNLKPLVERVTEFEAAGRQLNQVIARKLAQGKMDNRLAERINQKLMQVESNWLNADGIPGRPWFKHTLYAARFTYAHLELPGLTEAVEEGKWKVARQQARILAEALSKNAALLGQARAELNK